MDTTPTSSPPASSRGANHKPKALKMESSASSASIGQIPLPASPEAGEDLVTPSNTPTSPASGILSEDVTRVNAVDFVEISAEHFYGSKKGSRNNPIDLDVETTKATDGTAFQAKPEMTLEKENSSHRLDGGSSVSLQVLHPTGVEFAQLPKTISICEHPFDPVLLMKMKEGLNAQGGDREIHSNFTATERQHLVGKHEEHREQEDEEDRSDEDAASVAAMEMVSRMMKRFPHPHIHCKAGRSCEAFHRLEVIKNRRNSNSSQGINSSTKALDPTAPQRSPCEQSSRIDLSTCQPWTFASLPFRNAEISSVANIHYNPAKHTAEREQQFQQIEQELVNLALGGRTSSSDEKASPSSSRTLSQASVDEPKTLEEEKRYQPSADSIKHEIGAHDEDSRASTSPLPKEPPSGVEKPAPGNSTPSSSAHQNEIEGSTFRSYAHPLFGEIIIQTGSDTLSTVCNWCQKRIDAGEMEGCFHLSPDGGGISSGSEKGGRGADIRPRGTSWESVEDGGSEMVEETGGDRQGDEGIAGKGVDDGELCDEYDIV